MLDDRFPVCFFLPLLLILLLFPPRHLRTGIVITSLIFIAYVFGTLYVLFWLAMCVVFYWITQRFARQAELGEVSQRRLTITGTLIIGGWFVITLLLHNIRISSDLNYWLFHHVPWIFPLLARKFPWETYHFILPSSVEQNPPQLMFALFFAPQTCGLVIFTIRMMHYFSELKWGTIPAARRTFLNFLAYVSYAPTLIFGPIERFAEFDREMDVCHTRRSLGNVARGLARITLGVGKSVFCTLYLFPLVWHWTKEQECYVNPQLVNSTTLLTLILPLNLLWLYLEFSGYCDISAGIAHVLGYRQIENFRYPWLSTSLRDFWRRWHISFSFILRDYVYFPLGGSRHHNLRNLLVTFVVCGIMHNFDLKFALWGVVMALMIMVNQLWARWMKRLDEHPERRLTRIRHAWLSLQPLPRICAWVVTMNAFFLSCTVIVGGFKWWHLPWELIRRTLDWLA